jgi:hypothetical protein
MTFSSKANVMQRTMAAQLLAGPVQGRVWQGDGSGRVAMAGDARLFAVPALHSLREALNALDARGTTYLLLLEYGMEERRAPCSTM